MDEIEKDERKKGETEKDEIEKNGTKSAFAAVLALFQAKDTVNLSNVRLSHLKYMLIFPLAPVFANMQGSLFGDSVRLFGLDAMTLMGSAYCIGAGLLFAFTNVRNMAGVSRVLAITMAAAFSLWCMMPESTLSLLTAIFFMLCLGGCAACASFTYAFALNNTERLLGAASISLFFALNQLDAGLNLVSGLFEKTYITLLVAGTSICLLLYKTGDFPAAENRTKATLNPALKLMLYFFFAHIYVEIFYTYLPGASLPGSMIANGAVGVLVVFLTIAFQLITKRSIWNMCNLFFLAMICTYLLYFLPEGTALRNAARFIHGFEQMGYIAAYYLLGCVFKKHGDFHIFKMVLVSILPITMISYIVPGLIVANAPELLPLAATIVSGAIFIFFILLSPAYAKHLFYADWSDDFYAVDMTEAAEKIEQSDALDNLDLSPREKEIAVLLLHGETAKKIATALGISVHTVNYHIRNLYKKLNITSRSELFIRFVPTMPPGESKPHD